MSIILAIDKNLCNLEPTKEVENGNGQIAIKVF
jgi:hypothetical protein